MWVKREQFATLKQRVVDLEQNEISTQWALSTAGKIICNIDRDLTRLTVLFVCLNALFVWHLFNCGTDVAVNVTKGGD